MVLTREIDPIIGGGSLRSEPRRSVRDEAREEREALAATLLWGCESFRTTDRDDGVWVVHGHFVVMQPAAERGRIAVDTGAYFSDRLTAARIAGGEVTFLEG